MKQRNLFQVLVVAAIGLCVAGSSGAATYGIVGPTSIVGSGVQTIDYDLVLIDGGGTWGLQYSIAVMGASIVSNTISSDASALNQGRFSTYLLAPSGTPTGAVAGTTFNLLDPSAVVPSDAPFVMGRITVEFDTSTSDHFTLSYHDGLVPNGPLIPFRNYYTLGDGALTPDLERLDVWRERDGGGGSAVPEPSAALVFGLGMLIVSQQVRRNRKG